MSGIAVIGIGSPFGADRLGWDVIERLRTNEHDVVYECWQGPLTGLVARLQDLDAAILVDAALNNDPVGQCCTLAPSQLDEQGLCLSSHGVGLADTIALARTLHALPARLFIVAAEVGDVNLPAPPDVAVRNAMAEVEYMLHALIQEQIVERSAVASKSKKLKVG